MAQLVCGEFDFVTAKNDFLQCWAKENVEFENQEIKNIPFDFLLKLFELLVCKSGRRRLGLNRKKLILGG